MEPIMRRSLLSTVLLATVAGAQARPAVVVRDDLGRALRGIPVTLRDAAGKEKVVTTDLQGRFTPPEDFSSKTAVVTLGAQQAHTMDFKLTGNPAEAAAQPQELKLTRPQDPVAPKKKIDRVRRALDGVRI